MNILVIISTSPQFWGYAFLIIGIAIKYIIGRRRFNRRGLSGLQEFGNYEKAVATTFLEWLFKWIALALILVGIFMIIKW